MRSTLLHLPDRGPLRGKLAGPFVTVFFRLQTDFLMVQKASRNKSQIFPRVSIHEEFVFFNDFSLGPRDLLEQKRFWTDFGIILERILKI